MAIGNTDKINLGGKVVILGVSGSIAAYKAADLTSELRKAGAEVFVAMTESAERFITPMTLATLKPLWHLHCGMNRLVGNQVISNWQTKQHLFVVAPATANQIANFAHGQAPDILGSIYLATRAPVLIAPAMNGKMYDHPATQQNLESLRDRGVYFVDPVEGELACGYEGWANLLRLKIF